jgi:hypothetical protein
MCCYKRLVFKRNAYSVQLGEQQRTDFISPNVRLLSNGASIYSVEKKPSLITTSYHGDSWSSARLPQPNFREQNGMHDISRSLHSAPFIYSIQKKPLHHHMHMPSRLLFLGLGCGRKKCSCNLPRPRRCCACPHHYIYGVHWCSRSWMLCRLCWIDRHVSLTCCCAGRGNSYGVVLGSHFQSFLRL